MPKMLFLKTSFSGSSRYLMDGFRNMGWELTVVEVPFPKTDRILALALNFRFDPMEWIAAAQNWLGQFYKRPSLFMAKTRFCQDAVERYGESVDVIFQTQSLFMPVAGIEGLRTPYTVFTDYTNMLADKNPYWRPFAPAGRESYELEKRLFRNASAVFITNENARRSLVDDYGVSGDRAVVARFGAPFDKLPEDRPRSYDGKTILFIGKDFERKGGWVLVEAFRRVRQEIPAAELIIAGPQKYALKIRDEGISILGRIGDRERIGGLYKKASLFAMPSLSEPSAQVFLEAMAYKLPCVSTDVDGTSEIVKDGQTGLLVKPKDAQALAGRIVSLLKDQDLMKKMGEYGYARVRSDFTWERTIRDMDARLRAIIAGKGRP
ncbi:MAG: glycosyltransferase family 4 protein [Candidatus Omnitrophota bacterium]